MTRILLLACLQDTCSSKDFSGRLKGVVGRATFGACVLVDRRLKKNERWTTCFCARTIDANESADAYNVFCVYGKLSGRSFCVHTHTSFWTAQKFFCCCEAFVGAAERGAGGGMDKKAAQIEFE